MAIVRYEPIDALRRMNEQLNSVFAAASGRSREAPEEGAPGKRGVAPIRGARRKSFRRAASRPRAAS